MNMHRIMLRACLLLLLSATALPKARAQATDADSAPPLLTLEEALRIALDNNRDVQISELSVAKARDGVAEAKTNYLPKLDANALAGIPMQQLKFTIPAGSLGSYPSTGPIPGKDAVIHSPVRLSAFINASAAQPLTQLYKVKLSVQESRLGIDLASEQVRAQQQEIRRQVKEAYYQLAQTQPQVESAEAVIRYLAELSKLAEQRLKVQTALASDSLTVKAKLKQQQYQLLTLQDSIEVQKQNLNLLLGRDLNTQFSIEEEPIADDAELDLETARKQALEQRPEVREAHLEIKVAQLDVRRERAEYIPNVSLAVNYLSFQNTNFLPQNAGSAGLQVQWQPWDWGYKKHRVAELASTTKQKVLTEQDTEQHVLLDVDNTFRKLEEARVLLEAQAETREADKEKLREMTDRYKQQTALLSELLQQQSSVSQADAQYTQALQGFWTARAEFEKAIGAQ
jgi:outer membrane protein TolC